eukprot:9635286-Alexandrium_andersonii.AAC.1
MENNNLRRALRRAEQRCRDLRATLREHHRFHRVPTPRDLASASGSEPDPGTPPGLESRQRTLHDFWGMRGEGRVHERPEEQGLNTVLRGGGGSTATTNKRAEAAAQNALLQE